MTVLYILAAWIVMNVLFAAGMYFRPVRKAAPGSPERRVTEADVRVPAWNRRDVPGRIGSPALAGKILLFALWLNDRRRPV